MAFDRQHIKVDKATEHALNRFQRLATFQYPPQALTGREDTSMNVPFEDNPLRNLYGPLYGLSEAEMDSETRMSAVVRFWEEQRKGTTHHWYHSMQVEAAKRDAKVADDVDGINIAIVRPTREGSNPPFLATYVIINNAEDAERIAKLHVKKAPNFTPQLFDSLIATQDNEHWRNQRNHFQDVFLPKKSLANIFPVSVQRAKKCAEKLETLRQEGGPYGVQMHDFFLHEAQAQLQLALFGMDEEFMEATNCPIRDAFAGRNKNPEFAKDMCLAMLDKVKSNPDFAAPSDKEVLSGEKKVFGPLSKSVSDAGTSLDLSIKDQFGNMMLILFAGHDTTGHTMTWLTYELARNPQHQERVQREIDEFFNYLDGREMTYDDLKRLPFLTRCVFETLRLWPAVQDGSFRQLQRDEYVQGPGGKTVKLLKGTYIQLSNWSRHRSVKLWGPDANEFNPNRDFKDEEIWEEKGLMAYNPASKRFSPFTFQPRDCMGKNFAQMEMRTIMAHVLHEFSFTLSEPYAKYNPEVDGPLENNQGTTGPRDMTPEGVIENDRRAKKHTAGRLAMYLNVHRRVEKSSRL